MGRFANRDPIRYEGSQWNLYQYVRGRATVSTDAAGLRESGRGHFPEGCTDLAPDGPFPTVDYDDVLAANKYSFDGTVQSYLLTESDLVFWDAYVYSVVDVRVLEGLTGKSFPYAVIHGDLLWAVRAEPDVIKLEKDVESRLRTRTNSRVCLPGCGNNMCFIDRGGRVVTIGGWQSLDLRLTIQGASIWWEAFCESGPVECGNDKCGCSGRNATGRCVVNYTLNDPYDFDWFVVPFNLVSKPFTFTAFWTTSFGFAAETCCGRRP